MSDATTQPQTQTHKQHEQVLRIPARMTLEEFFAFEWPQGTRWELIEGAPVEMVPAPDFGHQVTSQKLYSAFDSLFANEESVALVYAPFDVVLPSGDVFEPDLVLFDASKLQRTSKRFEGVPQLVIEILSDSNRSHEEVTKYRAYERAGVPEYWIVDPKLPALRIHVLTESPEGTLRYRLQGEDTEGFTVSPRLNRRVRLLFDEPLGYRLEMQEVG